MLDEEMYQRNIEALKKKSGGSPRMTSRRANKAKSPAGSPVIGSENKKSKEARTWDGKISAKDAKSLDYSNSEGSTTVNADHLVRKQRMVSGPTECCLLARSMLTRPLLLASILF
jgi:signal recognition particle receptor subunit alpha